MFGLGGDPFQGQQQQGPWSENGTPLGNLQNEVAGVLNQASPRSLWIPTGPGEPTIQLPRPQYQQAQYRPVATQERLTRGDLGVLVLALAVVAAVVGVVLLLVR